MAIVIWLCLQESHLGLQEGISKGIGMVGPEGLGLQTSVPIMT